MHVSRAGKILRFTKNYWFLITLAASLLLSLGYMVVFHVTPWDTYSQIETRRQQVSLHSRIGQHLLERGQYALAKAEFDRGLALDSLDQRSLHGQYLAELFLSMLSPSWDPATAAAMRGELADLSRGHEAETAHVIEKYLGDLELKIGNVDEAKAHYEAALRLSGNYLDGLYTYGWFTYAGGAGAPDTSQMETLFRRMTKADPYDYRGFHGLGYALYMQALKLDDADSRRGLLNDATLQSSTALRLKIQQLNVIMDFGEIARAQRPDFALTFHRLADKLLSNPDTAMLEENKAGLQVQLLIHKGETVFIAGEDQRRAWVNYETALDHLALQRRDEQQASGTAPSDHEQSEHDRFLAQARLLDKEKNVYAVYADQLAILDKLVPGKKMRRKAAES